MQVLMEEQQVEDIDDDFIADADVAIAINDENDDDDEEKEHDDDDHLEGEEVVEEDIDNDEEDYDKFSRKIQKSQQLSTSNVKKGKKSSQHSEKDVSHKAVIVKASMRQKKKTEMKRKLYIEECEDGSDVEKNSEVDDDDDDGDDDDDEEEEEEEEEEEDEVYNDDDNDDDDHIENVAGKEVKFYYSDEEQEISRISQQSSAHSIFSYNSSLTKKSNKRQHSSCC